MYISSGMRVGGFSPLYDVRGASAPYPPFRHLCTKITLITFEQHLKLHQIFLPTSQVNIRYLNNTIILVILAKNC